MLYEYAVTIQMLTLQPICDALISILLRRRHLGCSDIPLADCRTPSADPLDLYRMPLRAVHNSPYPPAWRRALGPAVRVLYCTLPQADHTLVRAHHRNDPCRHIHYPGLEVLLYYNLLHRVALCRLRSQARRISSSHFAMATAHSHAFHLRTWDQNPSFWMADQVVVDHFSKALLGHCYCRDRAILRIQAEYRLPVASAHSMPTQSRS